MVGRDGSDSIEMIGGRGWGGMVDLRLFSIAAGRASSKENSSRKSPR